MLAACRHSYSGGSTSCVNSRDVAEMFEKDHPDVLRNIRELKIDGILHTSWYRPQRISAGPRGSREAVTCLDVSS